MKNGFTNPELPLTEKTTDSHRGRYGTTQLQRTTDTNDR